MIFLCFISTIFISVVYGQVFEFDENDYIGSTSTGEGGNNNQDNKDSMSSNNEDATSTNSNSEDTDKENCINNQIESVLASNYDLSSDPYTSEFHFVKKFDKDGRLIDEMTGKLLKQKLEALKDMVHLHLQAGDMIDTKVI